MDFNLLTYKVNIMRSCVQSIPSHLHKYIVQQDYSRYTPEDQEVWRFIMRQLIYFLKNQAHPTYIHGLECTGITEDSIPKIEIIDEHLKPYGWRAVAVSGFIPPVAFMEFQSYGILPIASDMRTVEHILYTPAPDIVHEAAGHAPLLINEEYTEYLRCYADAASKSIISFEDLNLYEAIRDLSDIKESPDSTSEDIKKCEDQLQEAISKMSYASEAQLLGRMNWWTAEYGLIGDIQTPKIYGAGLLSSIEESQMAIQKTQKIPLSINCVQYSYDITEPQPQLFVAQDFSNLKDILEEMTQNLAFKTGGLEGLKKAQQAQSVCTIKLDNQDSYSGVLSQFTYEENKVHRLKFIGPVQICQNQVFVKLTESPSFTVTLNPASHVNSVHGGPVYFEHYPETIDFVTARVPKKNRSSYDRNKFNAYENIRRIRMTKDFSEVSELTSNYFEFFKSEWLMGISLLELCHQDPQLENPTCAIMNQLSCSQAYLKDAQKCISLGLNLLQSKDFTL